MRVRRVDVPAAQWTTIWGEGDRVSGVMNVDIGHCIIKEAEGNNDTWGWPLEAAPEKRGEGGCLMLPTVETMGAAFKAYSAEGTTLAVLEA
jgi:hypothetical protein